MLDILVVDDSKIARKRVIETIIKSEVEHCIVGQANDGLEGLALYKELKPNLVFSDIEMPNMDGLDLIKEIRKIDRDVNIIVVTSVANEQLKQTLKVDKWLEFIKKPMNSRMTTATLKKIEYKLS